MRSFEKTSAKEPASAAKTETKANGMPAQTDYPLQLKTNTTGLPDTLKSGIESLSGHSLDDVKVHYNSSRPAAVNALAYAQGTDIHVAPGQEQHLAHEAWHVVQQKQGKVKPTMQLRGNQKINDDKGLEREADVMGQKAAHHTLPVGETTKLAVQPAAGVTIQRAVGFEFETNYKVERKNTGLKSLFNKYRPMKKMEVIKSYTEGFRMEADENSTLGSTIEFVIDPPVAEDKPEKLEAIMDRLDDLAGDLSGAVKDTPVDLEALTGDAAHAGVRVTAQGDSGLTANPQVTGGVSFDKLLTLLTEMGAGNKNVADKHKHAALELETMSPDAPGKGAVRVANLAGSAQLKGMAAVLTSYLRYGQQSPGGPLNYTKLISSSLLMRTDFGTMFKKLPEEEQEKYRTDPDAFVKLIMGASQLQNADAPVLERGVRKTHVKTSKDYKKLVKNSATKLTRRQWLTGITTGVDLLSSHHMPKLKGELEGLGALGPTTDAIGAVPTNPLGKRDKGQGIVMEFRNMRKNVPCNKWHPLATGIFNYLADLNSR